MQLREPYRALYQPCWHYHAERLDKTRSVSGHLNSMTSAYRRKMFRHPGKAPSPDVRARLGCDQPHVAVVTPAFEKISHISSTPLVRVGRALRASVGSMETLPGFADDCWHCDALRFAT
jgi:hypothetical protein